MNFLKQHNEKRLNEENRLCSEFKKRHDQMKRKLDRAN